ncbi:MAG: hypothetical protein ABFS39_01080 [Pseudomonadota bacterium]
MRLLFSEMPGRHERHLVRKHNNELFPESERTLTSDQLNEAQRLDHEELVAYIGDLRKLVGEAVALGPHEQSDVILELKERLDKSYETACRLADDQTPNKEAIKKLVSVVMQAVWKGAGNDSLAHQELEHEGEARKTHYELLEYHLVADLLDPESLIKEKELLPSLLTAQQEEFEAAVTLFDPTQLKALCEQGDDFIQIFDEKDLEEAHQRLVNLHTLLEALETS